MNEEDKNIELLKQVMKTIKEHEFLYTWEVEINSALNKLETQSKMINLMLEDMPTSDYHSKEWVRKNYEKKAREEIGRYKK